MKSKLTEVTFAKGAAILGVLAIHVTAAATVELPIDHSMYFFYFIINKASSFSVPAFIFFSGLVLFYQYPCFKNGKEILGFYRKRMRYLVLPYLVWSLFYVVSNGLLKNDLHMISIQEGLKILLTGKAAYHLYFIPLIAQYYLLFPLISYIFTKIAVRSPGYLLPCLLVSAAAVQIVMGAIYSTYHFVSDKSILSSTYLLSFLLGGFIGYFLEQSYAWVLNRRKGLFSIAILFLVLHVTVSILTVYQHPIHSFLRESIVQVYCIFASISLLILGLSARKKASSRNLLFQLGAYSFGIYIVHPVFLTLYKTFVNVLIEPPLYHLNIMIQGIVVAALPAVFVLSVKKTWFSQVLLGKMEALTPQPLRGKGFALTKHGEWDKLNKSHKKTTD